MSMITEQVKRLRSEAAGMILQNGTTARLLREAADTIEQLAAKVRAANMERSTAYYHGGWMPVKEGLPEDSGEYFVTVIDEDDETYRHTGNAWYAHPKDYDVEKGEWRELMMDEKVIAWMPLPEPYREDGETE